MFHLTAVQIGFLSAIWPASAFLLSFPCGLLSEYLGYLTTLRIGLFIKSAAFFLIMISRDIHLFCIALALFGFAKSLTSSSIRATINVLYLTNS